MEQLFNEQLCKDEKINFHGVNFVLRKYLYLFIYKHMKTSYICRFLVCDQWPNPDYIHMECGILT